jgi:hypothetical protein
MSVVKGDYPGWKTTSTIRSPLTSDWVSWADLREVCLTRGGALSSVKLDHCL